MTERKLEGFRMSPQQRRIWRETRGQARAACVVELDGPLDRARLDQALRQVVARHEILRTAFASLPGMELPLQVIQDLAQAAPELRAGPAEPRAGLEGGPLVVARLEPVDDGRHVLALELPALCCDAASLDTLVDDLAAAYAGDLPDRGSAADAGAPLQYADFSEWQHELLAEPEADAWRARSAAGDEPVVLHVEALDAGDADGETAADGAPLRATARLFRAELAALLAEGSPDSVFLAAWATLLWHVAPDDARERLRVLVRFDMHHLEALAGAIGPFAKHLPVRAALPAGASFAEAAQRLEAVLAEAGTSQEHYDAELSLGAAATGFAFACEHARAPREARGLRFHVRHKRCDSGSFALALTVRLEADEGEGEGEGEGQIELCLEARAGAMSPRRLALLTEGLAAVLRRAAGAPHLRIAALAPIGPAEAALIAAWSHTAPGTRPGDTVHGMFERQVAATPEAPAVAYGDEVLAFAELDRRANRLAHALGARGVGPGAVVPLVYERGVDMLVGVLGILKAGAAYLPVDPHQPGARLALLLRDCGARVAVVQPGLAAAIEDAVPGELVLVSTRVTDGPAHRPDAGAGAGHLAYVIYTSGSTGTPKGTLVSHASVVNLSYALHANLYARAARQLRVAVNAPLIFDASVKQLIALLFGHCLCIVPDEVRRDGRALLDFLEAAQPDSVDVTPSQLELLLQAGVEARPACLPGIVLVGGEPIRAEVWRRLRRLSPGFYNVYGPTEATDVTTMIALAASPRPTIGAPLAGVRVHVLDRALCPVAIGVSGELCVAGHGVARGYLGRPGLTAERFVPDPQAAEPGARLYRTGDRVRWREDGTLAFLGRVDRQIKLRGFRIELGEIEAVLAAHPGVREAVVVLRDDPPGGQRLIAYVVPGARGAERVNGRVRHALPNGMAVVHQNKNETDYLYDEIFGKKTYSLYGITLPPRAVVLDVGANIGMFSLYVTTHHEGARIYAFEPLAPIYETLAANAGLYGDDLSLFNYGLSDHQHTAEFAYYPRYSMMSGVQAYARPADEVKVVKRFLEKEQDAGSVEAATLLGHADELLAGRFEGQVHTCLLRRLADVIREQDIRHIDLLKIDVQRAEMDVLRGLDDADWPSIDQIVMEVHAAPGEDSEGRLQELQALLDGHGFQVAIEQDALLEGTDRYNVYASKHGLAGREDGLARLQPIAARIEDARPLTADGLRGHARARLPEHMVPAAVVLLAAMPLTRNGKIDTQALPAPDAQARTPDVHHAPPRTPFEAVLHGIWCDLLGTNQLGRSDDFFQLGGHSLLATQLMLRVREALQVDVPLRVLFDHPTISALAQAVERARRQDQPSSPPPIVPVARDRDLPLSFAQERIWFLQALDPAATHYNTAAAVRVHGPLSADTLGRTLGELVRRHESLRTVFVVEGGVPMQRIGAPYEVRVDVEDAVGPDEPERLAQARTWAERLIAEPFDLRRGPLMRATALRLGAEDHVVVLGMHHIITDGWSMGVLVNELAALYPQIAAGQPAALPPLALQYADVAVWQRQWLQGPALQRQLAFWTQQLAGAQPLALPTTLPRPAQPSFRGAVHVQRVPAELTAAVRALSHRHGATLFMTLLAGFQALLGRYSGQDDLCVGTPVANRNHPGLEQLVGCFINTLVLRADLSGTPSFAQLLDQVRERALAAYTNQDLPFEQLVEALEVPRELGRHPLFQVMFVLQNAPGGELSVAGLRFAELELEAGTAKFDLTLVVQESADELVLQWTYNTDLFDQASVARMARQYDALLSAAVAAPDTPVHALELGDAAERALVAAWNATETELGGGCLHELVAAQATRTPGHVAMVFDEQRLTYAELLERAHQLAHHLRGLGVGPDVIVAVLLERSVELVVALLGIIAAGGAYLPLDPEHPAERLAFAVRDAGAPILLTCQALAHRPAAHAARVICLDTDGPDLARHPTSAPDSRCTADHLAYVIYTSGSTGIPKGVAISHRNIVHLIQAVHQRLALGPEDRFLLKAQYTFDASVWELFAPLVIGATLVVARPGGHRDPAYLADLILSAGVTTVFFVPAIWPAFLDEMATRPGGRLRIVLCGGEVLSRELVTRSITTLGSSVDFYDIYGPTETTVYATCWLCRPDDRPGAVPIGTPTPNTHTYVLDGTLRPVPVGMPGELCIGGVQVARGYLGRPALTAERFVPDPSSRVPGARMYRTGDLARYRPAADGAIEFLGRIDYQIKLRGLRIELGEIEAALRDVAGIRDAVVVVRDERLAAYLVATGPETEPGAMPTRDALRETLRARLPAYMIPDSFTALDALPLTSSGKLDRKALPAPMLGDETSTTYAPPRTPAEHALVDIWAEVLARPPATLGIHDDFFAAGGHSLLAVQVVARIRDRLDVDVPLRALFEAPTVAALASLAARLAPADAGDRLPHIQPAPRDQPLPLSLAQLRIWFLQRLDAASGAYNIPVALRLGGPLDPASVQHALTAVVTRHELLRTSFPEHDGRPVQLIHPPAPVPLPVIDLSALAPDARLAQARRRADDDAQQSFDLAHGPLLRIQLLRLGPDDHALLLCVHHLVADGWSLPILLRELAAGYEHAARGGHGALPGLAPLAVQYADVAAWQHLHLVPRLGPQLAYWRDALAGAPAALELPTDRPRPPVQSFAGATVAFSLDEPVTLALEALGHDHRATLFMVLQSAWAVLLGRYARQDQVVIGAPVANRSQAVLEPLIGMFVNTLALRNDLAGQPSFAQVLARGRDMVLGAFAHQELPFEQLVEALQPVRDMSRNPLFQAAFTLEHERAAPPSLPGVHVLPLHDQDERTTLVAKFDLSLGATRVADGLEAAIAYNTSLFEQATITRMARHFGALLAAVVAAPEARHLPVHALVLGDAAERALVAAWNATETELDGDGGCLHELIAAQAARTPGHVAMMFDEQRLTYAELLERAHQLAHHLRGLGVGPDVIVAVLLERSVELVVTLLGILAAGGAYLPLDPEHPTERLAFAVRDAGAPILLTCQALAHRPAAHAARVICLDTDGPDLARHPTSAPDSRCTADHLAYVIYTSGSTGIPKGVAISHRNIVHLIQAVHQRFALGPEDRFLLKAQYTFDASVWELFAPLVIGATLVVARPGGHRDPAYLADLILSAGVTTVFFVPAIWPAFLDEMATRPGGRLRIVLCGGEVLSRELVTRSIATLGSGVDFYDIYGPTETTVYATCWLCRPDDRPGAVPIGTPTPNTRTYLLDGALRPVPVGMPGELCIGGVQVARGYLGRPALTAERFVPDPGSRVPGARMYRTGDLARYRPAADGAIEFLGRIDYQIKLRGLRIELGEIEAALRDVAGIRDAVVVVRDERLAAYLVATGPETEPGAMPTRDALRETLRARLPVYMIPDSFTALDALPLTSSGKLDRKALPAPVLGDETSTTHAPPRTPAEHALVDIWAEVLARPPATLGIHDDFFAAGGHSLLAVQVVARIRDRLDVDVPLRALFEAPTVAALASLAARLAPADADDRLPHIQPAPRDQPLPLSLAQLRIWFLQRLDAASGAYNIPVALRLGGPLDPASVQHALTAVVTRHELLRTSFPEHDGRPVQLIHPPAPVPLPVIDLSALAPDARLAQARRRADDDAQQSFDLAHGPLLRIQLLRLGPDDHALLLCVHHLVADGWSLPILLRELAAGYEHAARGGHGALPGLAPLAVQYADVAAWQHLHLVPRLGPQLAYWRDALAGAPAALELPTDRPRPPVQSFAGATVAFSLDEPVTLALEALGHDHRATLFMVLQSAWAVLLGRYARQDQVVIGAPVANRSQAVLEPLIGMFVNTLALRNDLAGQPSFAQVLARGRDMVLGAFAHQELPFEQLVEALQPVRDMSRNPLFQAAFTLEHERAAPPSLPGVHVLPLHDHLETSTLVAKFDLSMGATRVANGLEAAITYNSDLFEQPTIARLARHFATLLAAVVAAPDARHLPVHALALGDHAERALLAAWNTIDAPLGGSDCLHELIAQQASRTPDRVALVHGDQQLTYAALGHRIHRLAHYLRRLGVGPECPVAVLDERGPDLVVALVAVLAAGGTYVPLDPLHPAERLAFTIRDSRATLLLTRQAWADKLPEHPARVVCLDREAPAIEREPDDAPSPLAHLEHLAYVIYTSGSTGLPKGVPITHRSLVSFLRAMMCAPGLDDRDTLLAVTTVSFDIAALELFAPLVCGACIVLATSHQAADADELQRLIERHGITVMQATPATWRMLVDAGWPGAPSLRILCGGEALPASLAAALCRRGRALWNLYGPTEATVWASRLAVTQADLGQGATVAIGRPLPGVTMHILDEALRPVALGMPGELCIGGVQLARGYLGRPALSAERFVPDPFSLVPGARMYRTGDLARYRPAADGAIEFLGRIDFQVKLRGFRIELGEIEAALRDIPGIRQAVVVLRDERLAAYLVAAGPEAEPGALPDRDALREHLRTRLPAYMIPDSFTALDALPLTSSGKLDRKALPAPMLGDETSTTYAPPRTPAEHALVDIWAEVLARPPATLGIHDDFFAAGGHSLLAVQVVARIRDRLDVDVPLRALFEAPTVAALASLAARLAPADAGDRLPPIQPAPRDQPLPLSLAQLRIWFLQRLDAASGAYNIPVALRLGGPLDPASVQHALTAVVTRHELLRTSFPEHDGRPVQLIHPPAPVPLPVIDLSALAPDARLAQARRRADDDAQQSFDLAHGPLLRIQLLRLGPDDHALLLCVHHLVADGWSLPILLRELAAGYEHAARGGHGALPGLAPLAVQYADVAAWQHLHLVPRLGPQLAYWRDALAGAPAALELPTDRPRPPVQSFAGATVAFSLDEPVTLALEALGHDHRATLFMVLQSAWAVLLGRYARQDQVVIGAPVANRSQAVLEPLIGMFVNTLALRNDLAGQPSFAQVLARGRDMVLGAFAHQELPFEQLVEALQPVRDMSRNPLFQAAFTLEHERAAPPTLPGVRVLPLHDEDEHTTLVAKFDLSLGATRVADGLEAAIAYNTSLFEHTTIARMARHFATLLAAVVAAPEARHLSVHALALGDAAERALVAAWNTTDTQLGGSDCLHELIAAQAARTPAQVAVVFQDHQLTYAELLERAYQLAHHLRGLGVGPDVIVAVLLERSVELVVALLGILAAGGAYLPLDPEHPADWLAFAVRDAGAPVLVTCRALAARPAAHAARVICLDTDGPAIAAEPAHAPVSGTTADHLAYLIYTSGSTGLPKGVAISHRSIVNLLLALQHRLALAPADRVLLKTHYTFDASVWELFAPLVAGATLVIAQPGGHRDPRYLARLITSERVTDLGIVPSLLRSLLDAIAEQPEHQGCHTLRRVLCGAEALSPELVALFATHLGHHGTELYNVYGPTEAAVEVTCWPCRPPPEGTPDTVPIGTPLPNSRLYLLDQALQPVPVGVPGELCIGGIQVARGYLGRPALTAERFVPDPGSRVPGARMYRTGDLARYRPAGDGAIEFLGRIDFQVKLRGFRIELGEIEAALRDIPGIRQAVVVVRDERLAAYFVAAGPEAQPDALPAGDALREHLRARLPAYMIPDSFTALDALPLTTSGKLDRKALPAPMLGDETSTTYAPPRTPAEHALVDIWAEVLARPPATLGIHDDFFAAGGHSLLAVQVVARIRDWLDADVPLRALFEAPTVAALASLAARLAPAGAGDRLPPIQPAPRDLPLPLSLAQLRIWFLQRLDAASGAYNIPVALRLGGPLDPASVQHALTAVVTRHELLRTSFPEHDGRPVQLIHPPAPVPLPVIDLSALAPDARLAQARRRADDDAQQSFDLAHGPLLRIQLLRLGPDDHALLLCVHHLVADGWSVPILLRELAAGYEHAARGGQGAPPGLAPLAVQYADVAAWQHLHLVPRLGPQLAYWRDALAGAPAALELPTDRPRPPVQTFAGATVAFSLDEPVTLALEALGHDHRATLFMVLQSAWAVLLGRYARQDQVVIGVPVANRSQAVLEPLIGMFVNTLALRNDLAGQPSFAQVLARGRDMVLGAFAHQELPFEQLVEALQPVRDMSRNPLFQAAFTLEHERAAPPTLPGVRVLPLHAEDEDEDERTTLVAKFDLSLDAIRVAHGLEATITYNTSLFEHTTIARMARHFDALLAAVVAAPDARDTPVHALALGDEAERQLIASWNATETEMGDRSCLHELIAQQAARTPGQMAVAFEDQRLTYAELLERAHQLAHHLRGLGVGPDVIVAVLLERSLDLVVALLGILSAGGAYLPLDPEHPAERLAFAVRDARAPVLLTCQQLAHRPAAHGARVIRLDIDRTVIAAEPARAPASGCTAEHLAYVIYTSGSTGIPKGVENSHRGIINRLLWHQRRFPLGPGHKVLHKTPYTFDVSVWDLFWPLLTGATLVMARPSGHADPQYLAGLIAAQGITCVHFVPSMLRAFVEELDDLGAGRRWPGLAWVMCSGEALSPALVELFFARLGPGTELHNLYGPTEAAVDVTHWHCRPQEDADVVPIGLPVANTRIYLLDDALRPVPVGVPGELYIGGIQVARGYLGRPAFTAERFLPDPFSAAPGARLYRTGDLARYRPAGDGAIEFLGRIDFQVKLRGVRIELGEIEAVLRGITGIRDAVVVVRDERLAAYLVATGPEPLPAREALRAHLPAYMIPDSFTVLDAFPLTTSGKLDRKALPAPVLAGDDLTAYAPPRTPAEHALVEIWSEVLARAPGTLGIHDDFFALGGHSLLAVQVISRIRDRLSSEVPLRALFEAPSVAALAARLGAAGTAVELPPLQPASRDAALPLSFHQQGIWLAAQTGEAARGAYHIPLAFDLRGPLDLAALERAVHGLIRRHESLRTRILDEDGRPVQVIDAFVAAALPVRDLSLVQVPDDLRLAQARELLHAEAATGFDVARDHLFRVLVIRLHAEHHVMHILTHHIIWDGWSAELALRDLVVLYRAEVTGTAPALAPVALQYADFAVWQRRLDQQGYLKPQLDYWRKQLAGHQRNLTLTADRPHTGLVSGQGARVAFRVPAPERTRLLALAEAERCTVFMTLLAGFHALLHRYTGRDDLCLGTVVTGRTQVATEEIVGNFVNALALRTSLHGEPSFRAVMARVRDTVLDAFAHQELPFDRLVEALRPSREAGPQPFFQIVFALENLPARADSPEGLAIETSGEAAEIVKYDLVLWMRESADALTGSLGYRTQLFEHATMERLSRHYLGMLAAAVAEPDRPIAQLDYQTAEDELAAAEAARQRKESSVQRLKKPKPSARRGRKP